MSSRGNYIETDILIARNIVSFRPEETNTHIQPSSAPAIGSLGQLKWMTSLEFINSMKETLPIYHLQDGLSTVYQSIKRDTRENLLNGVARNYVHDDLLYRTVETLQYTYSYNNTSALYDCINTLTDLSNITDSVGPMVKFIRGNGQMFENRAFVKTANPGSYRIYSSTLGLQGSNLSNTTINNTGVTTSGIIDIGGYSNLIIPGVSKMRIDVNIGLQYSNLGKFSTFLLGSAPIGTPVVVNYLTAPSAPIGKITYFLTAADFINTPNRISIAHRGDSTHNVTTSIPSFGGIHVTLNNMD